MKTINTMKEYDIATTERATALLSSGDEAKVEAYFEEQAVVAKHIRDNYSDIINIVQDFKLWSEMTKDVLSRSTSFMKLIFTPEEITDILAACDDVQGMHSYWKEVTEGITDSTTNEEILEPFDAVINH